MVITQLHSFRLTTDVQTENIAVVRQTYKFNGWVGGERSSLEWQCYLVIANGNNNSCNSNILPSHNYIFYNPLCRYFASK